MIQKASSMVSWSFRAMQGDITASYLPGNQVDGLPGIAVPQAPDRDVEALRQAASGGSITTSPSPGNQVDGLPGVVHTPAVVVGRQLDQRAIIVLEVGN